MPAVQSCISSWRKLINTACVGLTELYLSRNDLGDGIRELATALQHNNRLTTLGLFVHHALDVGLADIAAALRHNESLTRLEYHASDSEVLRESLEWNYSLTDIQVLLLLLDVCHNDPSYFCIAGRSACDL